MKNAGEVSFETILELSELLPIENAIAAIDYKTVVTRGRSKATLTGEIKPGESAPVRQGSVFHVRYI